MLPTDPGASSIVVAVRVRPFTIREAAQLVKPDDGTVFLGDGSLAAAPTPKLNQRGLRSVIKVVDDRCLVFDPPEDNPVQKFSRSVVPSTGKKVKDQVFAFDRIFDDNASQMDVYEGTTKGLLDSVLDGYNATVFAYGATGCGKTHTITGTAQHPGIIFLTMQELFEKISERSDEKVTELTLSYLEIYNETIRDLLVPGGTPSASKQGLMLREDTNQAVTVAGLTSHHPKDVQEVMDMIVQGNAYRTVSPTEANAVSSRSHAVLQINVAQRDRNAAVSEPHTMATLSIIDLAGSERASATKNRGERLLEGANINKSLLALGGCINALCDPRKKNHVPYRNSKLTRLLKFSLGGNCKTVMIVCVSPSSAHFDETQNTLRYANRAKNIQTKVTRNVFNVNRHVKDFLVKIDEQMALINELRAQQKDSEQTFARKLRKQLDKRDAVAREGIQRLRLAYEHALVDRQQKIADMKKLRAIERRIITLTAWAAAFDTAAATITADDAAAATPLTSERGLPEPLTVLRQKTRGILAELEHSRQHLHQKIERSNWERPLDSALQRGIEQVTATAAASGIDSGVADPSDAIACMTSEAEVLKTSFARDAYREVLEQEKHDKTATASPSGETALLQTLLAAQFNMLAALTDMLAMDRDAAVAKGRTMLRQLVDSGVASAAQIVKPDPSPSVAAPTSTALLSVRGTPRRVKRTSTAGFSASLGSVPPVHPTLSCLSSSVSAPIASPTKLSPRRRKVLTSTYRKSVSFTPVKKRTSLMASNTQDNSRASYGPGGGASFKRSVRWRDDETEEGTLADFEKTPQKFVSPVKEEEDGTPLQPDTSEPTNDDTKARNTMTVVLEEETADIASPASPELPPLMTIPAYLTRTDLTDSADDEHESSPSTAPPKAGSTPPATTATTGGKASARFQAGFLSKTRLGLRNGSPLPFAIKATGHGSDTESPNRQTPLRDISLPRLANMQVSPPSASRSRIARLSSGSYSSSYSGSPKVTIDRSSFGGGHGVASTGATASLAVDENNPPSLLAKDANSLDHWEDTTVEVAGSSDLTSDLSSSTLDAQGLRSALHLAKKNGSLGSSGGGAAARRFSVVGAGHHGSRHHRASVASVSGGISRERRRSNDRRKSPPLMGLAETHLHESGPGRAFTPGQVRRMNMSGKLRWDSSSGGSGAGSPQEQMRGQAMEASKARRITIGSAPMTTAMKKDTTPTSRPSVVWR